MPTTYFLTGALGCIGAWTARLLLERGDVPVIFDQSDDRRRLLDLVDECALAAARFVRGDITALDHVRRAIEECKADRVIHLAGLQVPTCRADPVLGARVNVLGTLNVFEAARAAKIGHVVYASSAAVYGLSEDDAAPDESDPCDPQTHYGVFKRANEGNARIYWQDHRLSSVGLRPLTVYGVGRDQGLTSDPTRALKAAVIGRPFKIRFSGSTDYLHARDTAFRFIAAADRAPPGALIFNLHGETASVESIIDLIHRTVGRQGLVTSEGPAIPIPPRLDGDALVRTLGSLPKTTLSEGFAETARHFKKRHEEGRLYLGDLDA